MTFKTGDRVKETTTTTGTGTITLAGAVSQFRAFSDVAADGDIVHYAIVGQSGTEWEVGLGTWNTGGTLTRVAGQVSASSAGAQTLVTFSAGTKDVFITQPAGAVPYKGNRIINGDMRVDQRAPGSATITAAAFIVDRFTAANTTSGGTLTGVKSTLGNASSYKVTATSAITTLTTTLAVDGMQTTVEAQDIYDLNGKTVTLSFTAETNWTGNLAVSFRNNAAAKSYLVDVAVVSGTNHVSVTLDLESATITANDNGVGLFINIGFCNEATFQNATKGSWLTGNYTVSTTATQWCKTTGNYLNITGVQLEEGSIATPFKSLPITEELARCQRYYEGITSQIGLLRATTTNTRHANVQFKVTKRATPTITTTWSAGTESETGITTYGFSATSDISNTTSALSLNSATADAEL